MATKTLPIPIPLIMVVFSSNISEKLIYSSINGNYNIVKNSITPENDNNYYSQNTSFRFNWITWKNFTLQNELTNRLYTGLNSDYNQMLTCGMYLLEKNF